MKATDVLFVEDSAGDVLLTRQILAAFPRPVKLTIARDGLQALTILSDPTFEPVLIILDFKIPLIPGDVVLQRNPRKNVPVVVFSAFRHEPDVQRTLAL